MEKRNAFYFNHKLYQLIKFTLQKPRQDIEMGKYL